MWDIQLKKVANVTVGVEKCWRQFQNCWELLEYFNVNAGKYRYESDQMIIRINYWILIQSLSKCVDVFDFLWYCSTFFAIVWFSLDACDVIWIHVMIAWSWCEIWNILRMKSFRILILNMDLMMMIVIIIFVIIFIWTLLPRCNHDSSNHKICPSHHQNTPHCNHDNSNHDNRHNLHHNTLPSPVVRAALQKDDTRWKETTIRLFCLRHRDHHRDHHRHHHHHDNCHDHRHHQRHNHCHHSHHNLLLIFIISIIFMVFSPR